MSASEPPSRTSMPLGLAAKAGVALVAAAGIAAIATGCGGDSASSTYMDKAKSAYDDLTASATAISTRLGTATAKDIPKVTQAANSQLKLVSRADGKLRSITVTEGERPAHQALTNALAKQRDFLTVVVKTSKQAPGTAGISTMRTRAVNMIDGYRTFLAAVPEADAAITNTGLVKNVGSFAQAIRSAKTAATSAPRPAPAQPAPSGPGGFSDFITPSGKNACRSEGGGVYCSSNTSYAVFLGSSGPWEPVGTTSPRSISGSVLSYGSRWSTPDGGVTCFVQASGATGVYCQNSQGYGFRLWDGGLTSY